MSAKQIVGLVFGVFALMAVLTMGTSVAETVAADEVVVIQDPIDGELHIYTKPGLYWQNFGKVTRYKKSADFVFWSGRDKKDAQDKRAAEADTPAIKVRFNDGGHADVSGSLRFQLPLDEEHIRQIHTFYGSQEALERNLVGRVVSKAVYMTGPLMSSKESAAERRSDLIQFISDQVDHGIYKSETKEEKEVDPITNAEKTVTRVKLVKDPEKGGVLRQEKSPLAELQIQTFNFNLDAIEYDADVEAQIKQQQKAVMEVQTAIAEAKKAEQKTLTAAKEGEAAAAKAKWEQEAIKAKAMVEAQQEKEVAVMKAQQEADVTKIEAMKKRDAAKLASEAAEFTKQEQIKLGEGEAARKKAVMVADGALEKKLAAWVEVNKAYADQLGKQPLVPTVVMGGGGAANASAGMTFMDMLAVKTAQDLALSVKPAAQK